MKKILVIDDSFIQLRLIQRYLSEEYDVYLSSSAMEGLEIAKRKMPDLIIMDYDMPIINGAEATKYLLDDDRTKGIPVIFLTAINRPATVMEVSKLKPAGYLLKPVTPEDLIARIERVFDLS